LALRTGAVRVERGDGVLEDRGGRMLPKHMRSTWWLSPGVGLKRWILTISVGVALIAIGLTYVLRTLYIGQAYPRWMYYLFLLFLPRTVRIPLFAGVGVGLVVLGIVELNRTLLRPFVPEGHNAIEVLYRYHRQERGPKIVAIGGGHGLSTLLRGLKEHTGNITAIVTVADDGGSSGRLRRELGILPPGDFRNCMAALSEAEDLMTRLLQYRFAGPHTGLGGHSFGNLFIAAMVGVTGSFEKGLEESSRVLAVRGRVLPATLETVTLCAEVAHFENGELIGWERVVGESNIPKSGGRIMRVYLEPEVTHAYPEVLRAILEADLIVAGPGSLYTSVLPNLLVKEIVEALRVTQSPKVYIANLTSQRGETDGYTLEDHVRVLHEHIGLDLFQMVLYNTNYEPPLPPGVEWVRPSEKEGGPWELIGADLVDERTPWRHDPQKLAEHVMAIIQERRLVFV